MTPKILINSSANGINFKVPDVNITGSKPLVDIVNELFGVNPGEQLTFAAISVGKTTETSPLYISPEALVLGDYGHMCRENSFNSYRIVFSEYTDENAAYWDANFTSSTTKAAFMTALKNVTVESETAQFLLDMIESQIQITEGVVSADPGVLDNGEFMAGAFIRSKYTNGAWNYSTANMKVAIPTADYNYGVPPAEAVASYTNGVSVGDSNDPFLDEGGNGGSLE